jgi:hypothetical protein
MGNAPREIVFNRRNYTWITQTLDLQLQWIQKESVHWHMPNIWINVQQTRTLKLEI